MNSGKKETATRNVRQQVKERLRCIDSILKAVHKTPDLGNVSDPVEELVFLTITQRT